MLTTGNSEIAKNITDVFGHTMMPTLLEFQQETPDEVTLADMNLKPQEVSKIAFK